MWLLTRQGDLAFQTAEPSELYAPENGLVIAVPVRQGEFLMHITTMESLFMAALSDLHNAEKQIIKALPKMAGQASDANLKAMLENCIREAEGHIVRLDTAFVFLDEKIRSDKCDALEGLVQEAEGVTRRIKNRAVMDAALIAVVQKIAHYQIASYGTLCAIAKNLGYTEVASLLHETLEEEKAVDEKLTMIAKSGVNERAQRAA